MSFRDVSKNVVNEVFFKIVKMQICGLGVGYNIHVRQMMCVAGIHVLGNIRTQFPEEFFPQVLIRASQRVRADELGCRQARLHGDGNGI